MAGRTGRVGGPVGGGAAAGSSTIKTRLLQDAGLYPVVDNPLYNPLSTGPVALSSCPASHPSSMMPDPVEYAAVLRQEPSRKQTRPVPKKVSKKGVHASFAYSSDPKPG